MATIEKRINGSTTSFRVKVRLKGYPTQTATFERLTDARKWVQHSEAAMREGRHFKTSEAKKHTLGELIDRYVKDVLPTKPKSEKKQKAQLGWWKAQIGAFLLADITPALISEHRDKLLNEITRYGEKRNPATVVRYMAALSHALSVAANEWGWLEDSPMRKVRKPKESRGRVRFLSDTERKALLIASKNSSNKMLYTIVVLALSTGMRQGEIMNLRWRDLDLEKGTITLHETKNGERRKVPLTGHALECIRKIDEVKHVESALLFGSHINRKANRPLTFRKPWLRALEEAQIEDFRFNDLRHSTASYLAMNGATLAEIAEVLGHKTLQMVKRYAHLSDAHTSKVVEKMNNRIFGL
jgi:integrase